MWSNEKTLKQQLEKYWEKGIFLTAAVSNEVIFPLKLKLAKPNSQALTDQFNLVRQWVATLANIPYIRIEWQRIDHRIQGEQLLPQAVYIDSLETVLAVLHKQNAYRRFVQLVEITQSGQPKLLSWLIKYPHKALQYADQWQHFLNIIAWKQANLNPQIYLRQVDIPQIHSKLIEQHRGILSELFDIALPEQAISHSYSGVSQFNARYGFCDKPAFIRFRNLDHKRSIFPTILQSDLSLDSQSFAQLSPAVKRIIIVENEINYLALPEIENSWAIFGAGYGWKPLAAATWLQHCEIYYWGDIDTHGFAILNQLRETFPHAVSFLMDEKTLLANRPFWSREQKPTSAELKHLTDSERQLYLALTNQQFGENIRLEQEFVPFSQVEHTLKQLFH